MKGWRTPWTDGPNTESVDCLGARQARASEEELARVLDGLNEILGLPPVSKNHAKMSGRARHLVIAATGLDMRQVSQ